MKELEQWASEFFANNPKGSKEEFIAFVRNKEKEKIESKFEDYKNKHIKFITKDL